MRGWMSRSYVTVSVLKAKYVQRSLEGLYVLMDSARCGELISGVGINLSDGW